MPVTASIFPLADIVSTIGGRHVQVDVLIPPGASPHVFEPSPQIYRQFGRTRLFVMVGAGMEFWAEKLIEANAGEDLRVIRAARDVRLIDTTEGGPEPSSQGHSDQAHGHRTGNPHIWLDPVLMDTLSVRICQALTDLDPDHAADYAQNLARFRERLAELDRTIQKAVDGFSIKEYVAFHPSWSYFARRYGLHEVGIIQQSPGRDPTPQQIEQIVTAVRQYHIRAVFAEPQFRMTAAEAIAQEAGAEVLLLDPLGGPEQPGRDSYLALMQYNLAIMKEAMR
jgi:zinc transport system substrate-binding protein